MNLCIRCKAGFEGRYPGSKICKGCSMRGAKRGPANHRFIDGSYTYETIRGEIRDEVRYCEKCSKDLAQATHYFWCVHHIDHDHYNNVRSNLQLLCKRCHLIEHKCWKNFTKTA